MSRIVLVTGMPDYDDSAEVHRRLDKTHGPKRKIDVLVHDEIGAGAFASAWCKVNPDVTELIMPSSDLRDNLKSRLAYTKSLLERISFSRVLTFGKGKHTNQLLHVIEELE